MLSRTVFNSARRIPTRAGVSAVRMYTVGRSEGSVAESRGFSKKEKAHEDQYINQHEQALLKKLRQQINEKQAELKKLEDEHKSLEQEATKKSS